VGRRREASRVVVRICTTSRAARPDAEPSGRTPWAGPAARRYERRRPEKTPLHKIVSENLESWLEWLEWRDQAERPVPGYVEQELRGYLECGLLCFGFARALCTGCRTGFVVAFSCKGRGVCPYCNGRHMAQTAAHLADHVIPPVPVRQWVISVPKRLRGMLADRPAAIAALTKIFLEEIERTLITASGGCTGVDTPSASSPRLGGISFLPRFGSALNHHMYLHACVTDGVFVPVAAEAGCDTPPAFLPARPITPADLAALTERVRRRVVRWFRMQRLFDAAAAADEAGEGRFEKLAPDARAASPVADEWLISRKTVEQVPLTGLSFCMCALPSTPLNIERNRCEKFFYALYRRCMVYAQRIDLPILAIQRGSPNVRA